MATHSRILAWRIPWTEERWWTTVNEVLKSQTELSNQHFHFHFVPCKYKILLMGPLNTKYMHDCRNVYISKCVWLLHSMNVTLRC